MIGQRDGLRQHLILDRGALELRGREPRTELSDHGAYLDHEVAAQGIAGAVAGIGVGTAVWSAAGCLGVQALFIAAPWMCVTLRLLGGAYLIFVGVQLIWRSWEADEKDRTGFLGPE